MPWNSVFQTTKVVGLAYLEAFEIGVSRNQSQDLASLKRSTLAIALLATEVLPPLSRGWNNPTKVRILRICSTQPGVYCQCVAEAESVPRTVT